jgi:hypothetical protein
MPTPASRTAPAPDPFAAALPPPSALVPPVVCPSSEPPCSVGLAGSGLTVPPGPGPIPLPLPFIVPPEPGPMPLPLPFIVPPEPGPIPEPLPLAPDPEPVMPAPAPASLPACPALPPCPVPPVPLLSPADGPPVPLATVGGQFPWESLQPAASASAANREIHAFMRKGSLSGSPATLQETRALRSFSRDRARIERRGAPLRVVQRLRAPLERRVCLKGAEMPRSCLIAARVGPDDASARVTGRLRSSPRDRPSRVLWQRIC